MSQHPLDRLTGGEIELNRMILDQPASSGRLPVSRS